MEILFWFAIAAVAWSYLGYPLALLLWSGLSHALGALRFVGGGPDRRGAPAGPRWPRVSIVFSAFDEEAWIARKVQNCLALDYPADKLEILVGCDGCTDRTAQLAREAGGTRVTVRELFPRAGKAAVLSRLVPLARGEVVILTDANVMLDPGAVQALVRRFRDGAVGAVVGWLRLYNPTRAEFEETLYWRYETAIKYLEGQCGCVLGANGGIYAIRRLLFSPLEPDTVTDDFVVPTRIALRGWRVPFEPAAVAREETTEDSGREFGRRARIGAGNWQALARVPGLLDPRSGFPCFAFVSHKLLRWATPLLLAAALLAGVALAARPDAWLYRAALAGQLAFYALALLGRTSRVARGAPSATPQRGAREVRGRGLRRAASLADYFVGMNAALAVGLWRFLRGAQRATWDRTARRAA